MMGSNTSHVKTIKVESAEKDDDDNKTYYFDSTGERRNDNPVVYRDKGGNLQFYDKDSAPVVWVPTDKASVPTDVQSVKEITVNEDYTTQTRANEKTNERNLSAKTSKSEGHVPDIYTKQSDNSVREFGFAGRKGAVENDSNEQGVNSLKPKTKIGFVSPIIAEKDDAISKTPKVTSEKDDAISETSKETTENEDSISETSKEIARSPDDIKPVVPIPREYTLFRDGTFIEGVVKTKSAGGPEFKPPSITRRDLIPEDDMFDEMDEHVYKTPAVVKGSMDSLISYLTEPACTPLDEVRAFFVWITHNINYDTSGYFGRSTLKPTDPESVLETRTTVCEGYARLFEAFCKQVAIPTKTIKGYVKGYGYKPGDDVTKDKHNAHMWNAVFIENNWFLCDVTLGAGYVKSREKTYVAKFNPLYFMADPRCFISDHFPFVKGGTNNETNQLLDTPITFEDFNAVLNMEKCGKEWGIEPVTHTKAVIEKVQYELDIQLQQTYTPMSDYIAFIYRDGKKLDQFSYTYKIDLRTVNIHAIMPSEGEHALIVYGRRKQDSPQSNLEPLVRYIIICKMAFDNPTPYPTHHTLYGLVDNLDLYGLTDAGHVYNEAVNGEVVIKLTPSDNSTRDYTDLLPRLFYGDHAADLKTQTFLDYSKDFKCMNLHARLPYIGYYKLVLFGKPEGDNKLKPFMTYLIENRKVVNKEGYPVSHAHALKYKCHLVEPLRKGLSSGQNYLVLVNIKSQILIKVKAHETDVPKSDDVTFEGLVAAPKYADLDFVIYGADKEDESYHPLYTCKMVAGNILSVPSAITLPSDVNEDSSK